MCLSFRSRWTWHRELFNSEAQDTKHDRQQLDQYWGNHLNGWHIGYSRVSTRHFWIKLFEDIHHQRSRRRMPNIGQILHMKFCVTFLLKMYRTFLRLNYVRPEFSRMRYVGGLCRSRSFHYQNFLFWLIVERETTFDLIPAPMGYVGATTARS